MRIKQFYYGLACKLIKDQKMIAKKLILKIFPSYQWKITSSKK